jgi:hypothetical protein
MKQDVFLRTVTIDESGFLDRLLDWLRAQAVDWCVIGGQAVNAYVEPLVSLDLDLVVATGDLEGLLSTLPYGLRPRRFEHSLNLEASDSDLRVQIQLDPRYMEFASRAEPRDVLGRKLPVARLEDVLDGKVWAASDPERRASKRQKDLADIARLLEAYPALRERVPAELQARLI